MTETSIHRHFKHLDDPRLDRRLNLLKKETTAKVDIKNKRLMAGWDETYLTKVIMCLKS